MKNENKIKVLGELSDKQDIIAKITNLIGDTKVIGIFMLKTEDPEKAYEIRVLSDTIQVVFFCNNAGVAIACGKELAADLNATFKQLA